MTPLSAYSALAGSAFLAATVVPAQSELVLAKDEAGADEIDDLLDDDEIEVIVSSKTLDAMVLIEDEALLALPLLFLGGVALWCCVAALAGAAAKAAISAASASFVLIIMCSLVSEAVEIITNLPA